MSKDKKSKKMTADEGRAAQRNHAIETWYRIFIDRNPNVTRDDIETCFDQLDETKPMEAD